MFSWLNQSFIKGQASSGSFNRGSKITRDVDGLTVNSGQFSAGVSGSNYYEVEGSTSGPNALSAHCSCPDNRGGFCKHICATLICVMNQGGSSSTPTFSFASSPQKKASPTYTAPRSPVSSHPAPTGLSTLCTELTQLRNNYFDTKDGSLLAKIATVIYKNAKEAVTIARFNPLAAVFIVQELLQFSVNSFSLLDIPALPLTGAVETIAKACSSVLVCQSDRTLISKISNHLSRNNWTNPSASFCWSDAAGIAKRKLK